MQDEPMEIAERYFFSPSAIEQSNAIWPIRLGRNVAKPNYYVGPRTTPYYSLHFVLEGSGTFVQQQESYSLNRNDLFCLFPNRTHEYFTSASEPLQMAWIAFDGKKALQILERIGIKAAAPYLANGLRPGVRESLDRFFSLIRKRGPGAQDFAKLGALFQVLGALADNEGDLEHRSADSSVHWLKKGLDYLEMHYAEGITIGKAATFVGVDRAYFSRKFQETFGTSPIKYVQNLKMKAARDMLANTDSTLTEIALSVGYPDLFSFSKAFKKHYDSSPGEYRRSVRNEKDNDN